MSPAVFPRRRTAAGRPHASRAKGSAPSLPTSGLPQVLRERLRRGGSRLQSIAHRAAEDLEAAQRNDPAARSRLDVALLYPGVHAVWSHRVAHALWTHGHTFTARALSQAARAATGIEIHPGAQIGRRLFIDHGMGIVIGETAQVGDDVVMYHGVTLGGVSTSPGKRHPTIGDRVQLGAGAKVLGPIIVRDGATVGANAVLVHNVPQEHVAVGVPARMRDPKTDPDLLLDPTAFI